MKIRKISEDFNGNQSSLSEVDFELDSIEKKFKNTGFKWEFKYRVEQNGLHIYSFYTDDVETDKIIQLMNALNSMVLNMSRSFDISEFSTKLRSEKINWTKISDEPVKQGISGNLILK